MKKYLALFVCLFSAVVFADDPSGAVGFDAASVLQSSVAPLISGLVVALVSLLFAASAIYLAFLGWRKYKEACYFRAVDDHDAEWLADNDGWIRDNGFIPLEDDPEHVECPCDDGSPCPQTDECPYFNGERCDLGLD